MQKHKDSLLREAKTITKWNKKRLNRKIRHFFEMGSGKADYKKFGQFDARYHTMA